MYPLWSGALYKLLLFTGKLIVCVEEKSACICMNGGGRKWCWFVMRASPLADTCLHRRGRWRHCTRRHYSRAALYIMGGKSSSFFPFFFLLYTHSHIRTVMQVPIRARSMCIFSSSIFASKAAMLTHSFSFCNIFFSLLFMFIPKHRYCRGSRCPP